MKLSKAWTIEINCDSQTFSVHSLFEKKPHMADYVPSYLGKGEIVETTATLKKKIEELTSQLSKTVGSLWQNAWLLLRFQRYCWSRWTHSPYSKMAAILAFVCFHGNWPFWLHFQTWNSKEYLTLNEAKRANLQSNKRILKLGTLWNTVNSARSIQIRQWYFWSSDTCNYP